MRDYKTFIQEIITELEKFFKSDGEGKKKIALELNSWEFDCRDYSKIPDWSKNACEIPLEDNSSVPKEVDEISKMLMLLDHYGDAYVQDEYVKSILDKCKKFLGGDKK